MAARTFARLASAGQGRRLFLLSWVAYAAAYVGRYNYSAVMSAITAEGTLTLSAAGAVSTGYFVCYAAGQILCGILSQKASPFGMIPLGLVLSAGCNFGMGVAPAGAMPLLWAANGLFQAMVWPPIVRLFAECMPFEQQDSACVSINSTTPAGTLGAYALSAAALALAGWRMAFWACGVLMLAAAVLWTVGSAPLRRAAGSASAKAAPEGPAARKAEPGAARRMLPALFAAGLVWLVVPAMLHGGLKDGVTSWAPSMIQSNFGASPAFSAAVSMVLPLVNLTGAYLAGWLDRVPRTPASENTTWRALEAGLRPENWLRALVLFGPAAPEALGRRIDESLAAHGAYLALAHGPFQRLSNWGAIQAHGLFLIGLWLGRADWQALALGRLEENLRHAVLPYGVQWEQSPMYHCEVLHALLDTLLLAERNGIAVPPLLPEKARAMCQALAVWAAPDRTILPQGDSDVIDAGDLLAAGALLFRDPLLAAAAQGPLCEETLWDFGPDAPARLAALPAAWPACPSQKLEASGNYILRSGWGREDTWIHFRAGSLGGGHGHADLLHVDVYHGGEAVLTDAGRGTYVDGGLRRALKGPAAHNTFRVDGAGFTCYRGTWEWGPIAQPLPALARFTPLADRLAGGHLGYLAQGAAVERQLVFLKPGLLVGADILRAPDGRPHRAEQFFHFGPGRLTAGESAALWEGGRTCAQLRWLSGQRAECFAAPCAPAYNRVEDAPALRLDAPAAAGVTALVWVLSLGGPCQAELVPVSTGAGQPLPPGTAGAVRIRRDGAESTVLFSWQAGSHDAGLLCAGDCTGHGNVLVFTPQCPQGLCLD